MCLLLKLWFPRQGHSSLTPLTLACSIGMGQSQSRFLPFLTWLKIFPQGPRKGNSKLKVPDPPAPHLFHAEQGSQGHPPCRDLGGAVPACAESSSQAGCSQHKGMHQPQLPQTFACPALSPGCRSLLSCPASPQDLLPEDAGCSQPLDGTMAAGTVPTRIIAAEPCSSQRGNKAAACNGDERALGPGCLPAGLGLVRASLRGDTQARRG